jgi:hypothetical protein
MAISRQVDGGYELHGHACGNAGARHTCMRFKLTVFSEQALKGMDPHTFRLFNSEEKHFESTFPSILEPLQCEGRPISYLLFVQCHFHFNSVLKMDSHPSQLFTNLGSFALSSPLLFSSFFIFLSIIRSLFQPPKRLNLPSLPDAADHRSTLLEGTSKVSRVSTHASSTEI